ncbi:MAG: coproporphyrinogen III oxidase [Phormidesmis priestleyi]|uniref:Heme chaperone HemW n=1 Tax=Phormidesmis priestleyi TaxID=268141 RepID=A0A2W4XAB1_9CYAN|nr:MAG: coproporphyrinogen III oxidase [Phormidesmis priestleyi]
MATSAYIHIPFCRRRCFYCDFAISVVGNHKRGDTSGTIRQYIDTLIAEIQATPVAPEAPPLETVFFGGGTPSLLAVSQLERILAAIHNRFSIAPTAELSIEMDPATFELAHIQGYQAAGINRVSLGVQDFHDDVLAASGRSHCRSDIFQAIELLHRANITNFSLDLISGLPHQTLETWQDSLAQAVAINPTHLSQYDLIVEPKTAFDRYLTPGEAPLPSDEHTAQMYRMAQVTLSASGYEHYEICNYAKASFAARHNLTYWQSQPCYGFGMGATSYLNHQRIDRPRTQSTYRQWVTQFIHQGGRTDDPVIPPTEQVLESLMVGLRLKQGISLQNLYRVYGERGLVSLAAAIAPHIQSQWLIIDPTADTFGEQSPLHTSSLKPTDRIRLSDPEGFLMSNVVIVDAFNALEALQP